MQGFRLTASQRDGSPRQDVGADPGRSCFFLLLLLLLLLIIILLLILRIIRIIILFVVLVSPPLGTGPEPSAESGAAVSTAGSGEADGASPPTRGVCVLLVCVRALCALCDYFVCGLCVCVCVKV